jgi:nucleoside-diphosphate-sugar epimerase
MNILITGSGGFIGTHLCDSLGKDHKLNRIDYFSMSASNSDYFSVDLTDGKAAEKLIDELFKQKIDVIIHLASRMASPDKTNDLEILRENIVIAENMVSLVKKIQPKKFINFSSMAVYPNILGLFSENSLPSPQKNTDCLYGLSKYCSEVIFDFLLRNENIHIIHMRVAQVYGEGMREDRIIPVMRKELEERNTITVFGNGERESCFIEINKLTECVEYFLHQEASGIYNLGDQNLSYYDLAKIMVKQYGNEESKIVKHPKGNKEKFNLDTSKLQRILNT